MSPDFFEATGRRSSSGKEISKFKAHLKFIFYYFGCLYTHASNPIIALI